MANNPEHHHYYRSPTGNTFAPNKKHMYLDETKAPMNVHQLLVKQKEQEALRMHRIGVAAAVAHGARLPVQVPSAPIPMRTVSSSCSPAFDMDEEKVSDEKYDREADYAYNDYGGDDDSKSSGTASRKEESKRRNSTSKLAHLIKSRKSKSKEANKNKPHFVPSASGTNVHLDPNLLATLSPQTKQLQLQLQRPSLHHGSTAAAAAGSTLTPLLGVGAPMSATMGLLHPHRPPLAVAAFPPPSILGNAPLIAPGPGAFSTDKLAALEQAEHRCRMAAAVHSAEARALQARLELKRLEDELEMARNAHAQPLPRYYSAVPAEQQLKKQGYPQLGIGLQQQLELQQHLGLERKMQDLLGNESSRGLLKQSFAQVGGRGLAALALAQSLSSSTTKRKKGPKSVSASKGSKAKSPKPRSSNPVVYVEPQENDVLCGRDKSYNRHPGNKVFKAMIVTKAELYCATSTKQEKMDMTKLIVNTLKAEHGARFLKPVKFAAANEPAWEEISDQLARDKVSHALRFTASHSKRKLEIPAGRTMVTFIETTNGD